MEDYKVLFRGFHDGGNQAVALASFIAGLLQAAVAKRGYASMVVSGGSTPVSFFKALSFEDIPWRQVIVTLADERWVDPSDSASNEGLVRMHLLRNRAAAAKFIGLRTEENTALAGEPSCEKRVSSIPRPFDVVVLGMGGDGHTASFFPGAVNLPMATDMNSGRLCLAVTPAAAPHDRMTLTLPALLDCREMILHITGKDKLHVFEKALAVQPVSEEVLNEMPIRHVLAKARESVTVFWAP
ncbi:MAG: 6-phosphogluconolactonase [Deltaproteobacteria bacterium]|nr:6-phosphogluconolactonase [Deltaproteobacteria bacterium]